jgi:hypothetical protein
MQEGNLYQVTYKQARSAYRMTAVYLAEDKADFLHFSLRPHAGTTVLGRDRILEVRLMEEMTGKARDPKVATKLPRRVCSLAKWAEDHRG